MTKNEFLNTLRRRLAGVPAAEIEDVIADYATHFADGIASGRTEEEIAAALGDPMRLARELRAEAGFRKWELARTPANFLGLLFGLLALVAVDFVFLLPVLGALLLFAFISIVVVGALCVAGVAILIGLMPGSAHIGGWLIHILLGIGFLGFGVGGGALLFLIMGVVVKALSHFVRLHFTLINRASEAV